MPQINRVRVNNVKYNFGTQYYDDFIMRFSGKNTIYDLANGGGKSVLMLLLFQNMIPNCTLDDKQPIEKLFRTNEGSTTIHSMIEWNLSEPHIKDNFRYMLTGFCARKAKENSEIEYEDKNTTAIEYFNYCIFYRKYNDNDIRNLPLQKNGEKVTYTGLKNYLKELSKNDLNLEVKIFEKKGDYQRFISDYGIYESEWEIIRGINKTEGHVRTYFENNYKTTRKVVEDLLIEEIIEKSFRNKYDSSDEEELLAKTLLNIKDKLIELSRKKDEINNFDRQNQAIDAFYQRINTIKAMYENINSAIVRLKSINSYLKKAELDNKVSKENFANRKLELIKEKDQLAMKVETAGVISDMNKIQELSRKYEEKNAQVKLINDDISNLNNEIKQCEIYSYYIEYLQEKKEYDNLKEVINNSGADKSLLVSRLRDLIVVKKYYDLKKIEELSEKIKEQEKISEDEGNIIAELKNKNRNIDNDIAILNYQINDYKKSSKDCLENMNKEKSKTSLFLPSEAKNNYKLNDISIGASISRIIEIEQNIKQNEKNKISCELELEKTKVELKNIETRINDIENKKINISDISEKLEKLSEVYGEKSIDKLINRIKTIYKNMVINNKNLENEIKQQEKVVTGYLLGNPLITPDSTEKLVEYINKFHGQVAISGVNYLDELVEEERSEKLKRFPVLSHCILIKDNFEQVVFDYRLSEQVDILGQEILINYKAVEELSDSSLLNDNMVFIINDKECLSKDKISQLSLRAANQLEEMSSNLKHKQENEEVVAQDYEFLIRMIKGCEIEESANYEIYIKSKEEYNKQIQEYIDSIRNLEKIYGKYIEEKNEEEYRLSQLRSEKEILGRLCNILDKYDEIIALHDQSVLKRDSISKEYTASTKHMDAIVNQNNNRKDLIASLKNKIKIIEDEFFNVYGKYYETIENKDKAIDSRTAINILSKYSINKEHLDTKVLGIYDSIRNENNAIEDKEKLLSNYKSNMKKALDHIKYLEGDLENLNKISIEELLCIVENQNIANKKATIAEYMKNVREITEEIEKLRSVKDNLQGKISHLIGSISEKYGYFQPDLVKAEEIDTFLNDNHIYLTKVENEINNINEKLKNLDENEIKYQVIRHDMDRLVEKLNISLDENTDVIIEEIDIESQAQEIYKQVEKFIDERYRRSEDFEREKMLLVSTLEKINAVELSREIRVNLVMPGDLQGTINMLDTLRDTMNFISLEKDRVLKGLEDMQTIKDNFENQCIQSCVNIRTELDRLDKLSRITLEGENIAIIKLKIPYISEELYKDRMSEYIDSIAGGIDGFDKNDDKIRYIRNNLCWKRLFSVIVSDMNSIKMNLYKRERISSQSRYLPYEEAVGSTGQSQGIYIQFLISIINYISSINSRNSDAGKLKKVIFIDNPFGAAKDIYIWEPIFKLLKTNNVQLVVPTRGATPAITSRFDVNYVLGQKICDSKQQTVVVNYFSNVENEKLEYRTLSYQQESLF